MSAMSDLLDELDGKAIQIDVDSVRVPGVFGTDVKYRAGSNKEIIEWTGSNGYTYYWPVSAITGVKDLSS